MFGGVGFYLNLLKGSTTDTNYCSNAVRVKKRQYENLETELSSDFSESLALYDVNLESSPRDNCN